MKAPMPVYCSVVDAEPDIAWAITYARRGGSESPKKKRGSRGRDSRQAEAAVAFLFCHGDGVGCSLCELCMCVLS
jgi:hypothetical protein